MMQRLIPFTLCHICKVTLSSFLRNKDLNDPNDIDGARDKSVLKPTFQIRKEVIEIAISKISYIYL